MDFLVERVEGQMGRLNHRICMLSEKVYALEAVSFPEKTKEDRDKENAYLSEVEDNITKYALFLKSIEERAVALHERKSLFLCKEHNFPVGLEDYHWECKERRSFILELKKEGGEIQRALWHNIKCRELLSSVNLTIVKMKGIDCYRIEDRLLGLQKKIGCLEEKWHEIISNREIFMLQ